MDTYLAYVNLFTEPATTTPPPHREHNCVALFFPTPWSLSCDAPATSRRVAMITLPVCWPSRHRTAAPRWEGAPGPLMPLCAAVAVRGTCVGTGSRAMD
jgi:hypothetical protein